MLQVLGEIENPSARDVTRVQSLWLALSLHVQDIRTQQERYMPALLRADHEMDISGSPERSRCFLPSELDDTR
jgi:hypothetical protein